MPSGNDATCPCPTCGQPARILVDVETETVPQTDEEEHKLYYCLLCEKWFAAENGQTVASLPNN